MADKRRLAELGMSGPLAEETARQIDGTVLGTGTVSDLNVAADADIATSKLADGTELAALVTDQAALTTLAAVETELSDVAGVGLSAAELTVLDAVTPGTGAASKALVLSAGDDVRMPAAGVFAAGVFTKAQGAPVAKTVTAAITAAELAGGLITSTGVTAPSEHQLPTGTLLAAEFPDIAVGDSFDFVIINTGTGASDDVTLTVNTDVTIVGNPTVGALTDATILSGSGMFRARYSAANTFIVYRVA